MKGAMKVMKPLGREEAQEACKIEWERQTGFARLLLKHVQERATRENANLLYTC